jgi:diguanylate cyclase (GGDEF)-like protein
MLLKNSKTNLNFFGHYPFMRQMGRRTRVAWSNPIALNRAIDSARRQSSHLKNIWQKMDSVHGKRSVPAKTAKRAYVSSMREYGKLDLAGKRQRLMDQREGFKIENPLAFQGRLFKFLRHVGSGTSFSIAVVDLDNLKKINDSGGHAAGNRALKTVIASLNRIAKKHGGFSASWTRGDEFRVFIPKPASVLARELNAQKKIVNKRGYMFSAGVTDNLIAGIESVPELDKKVQRLAVQADKAVYAAKNSGRNRVVLFK